jgi:hypothetical protein
MENKRIADQITYDIETGVYLLFPVLRERLDHIRFKLIQEIYVENRPLSRGEMKTLLENEYVNKEDYEDYLASTSSAT